MEKLPFLHSLQSVTLISQPKLGDRVHLFSGTLVHAREQIICNTALLADPAQKRGRSNLERLEDWGTASSVFLRLGLVGTISPSVDPVGILPSSFRESSLVFLISGM